MRTSNAKRSQSSLPLSIRNRIVRIGTAIRMRMILLITPARVPCSTFPSKGIITTAVVVGMVLTGGRGRATMGAYLVE